MTRPGRPTGRPRTAGPHGVASSRERLSAFLVDRLTEELGQLWDRDRACPQRVRRPDLASQLEVVDDLLTTLGRGGLPDRLDLTVLLIGYWGHPDFDESWAELL